MITRLHVHYCVVHKNANRVSLKVTFRGEII